MHLLWEKLMLKLISGSHWIYALKDQLRNISNVYFTFNWFRAFRVVASVEQMLLCYYQVNLLMWLLPTNIGMKSIHTSAEWFWRYWRQLFVSNFWFEKFADVTLVYENWNEVKAHIQFQWKFFFKLKWRFMKDKSTENCWLTEGWSKTSHLFHSRVRVANDEIVEFSTSGLWKLLWSFLFRDVTCATMQHPLKSWFLTSEDVANLQVNV